MAGTLGGDGGGERPSFLSGIAQKKEMERRGGIRLFIALIVWPGLKEEKKRKTENKLTVQILKWDFQKIR